MNILFFVKYFKDKASSRVRGFLLAEELSKKKNITIDIVWGSQKRRIFKFIIKLLTHDTIYFQKQYSVVDVNLNKLARRMGKKTLFDLDDAPFGLYHNQKALQKAIMMMKISSAVIVGSRKLNEFARKFNNCTYLIPSSINTACYMPKKKSNNFESVTLGWIGDGAGYKQDLLMLIRPLERLAEKFSLKLIIIGALGQKEIHAAFNVLKNADVTIIDSLDWADPLAVPAAIQEFDIGLYPLLDNDYNRYKCGFKALEYMAMQVPVVASPVGQTSVIIEDGKEGFLVSDEEQWYEKLKMLIENEELRKKMGAMGRKKVESSYSLKICANKFAAVLENLKESR